MCTGAGEVLFFDHTSVWCVELIEFGHMKVKELLVELREVDDEISRLERQISQLQADLSDEKAVNRELKSRNQSQQGSVTSNGQRVRPFEAKALHFISKAMKGDFTVNSRINDRITEGNGAKESTSPRINGSSQKRPVSPSNVSPRLNLTPKVCISITQHKLHADTNYT